MSKIVLVQGACGALGRQIVKSVNNRNWISVGVGLSKNEDAKFNVTITKDTTGDEQHKSIASLMADNLNGAKIDAVICASGGFVAGSANAPDLLKGLDAMLGSSVVASFVAAKVASEMLTPGGLVVLPGAAAATTATAWGLSYGASKAAVHHLVKSLSSKGSGIDGHCVGIAPVTIDTPANRQSMPEADMSSWTPLAEISEHICDWVQKKDYINGAIYKIVTKDGNTEWKEL